MDGYNTATSTSKATFQKFQCSYCCMFTTPYLSSLLFFFFGLFSLLTTNIHLNRKWIIYLFLISLLLQINGILVGVGLIRKWNFIEPWKTWTLINSSLLPPFFFCLIKDLNLSHWKSFFFFFKMLPNTQIWYNIN